jgi:uncharacterized protein
MTRRDWLLITLAGAQPHGSPPRVVKPVQVMKTLFLVGKTCSIPQEQQYNFTPYLYGPFDSTVYRDAEGLEEDGLIIIKRGRYQEYLPTAQGVEAAQRAAANDPENASKLLRWRDWALNLTFRQLVAYIYKHFPEMRARSIFNDTTVP